MTEILGPRIRLPADVADAGTYSERDLKANSEDDVETDAKTNSRELRPWGHFVPNARTLVSAVEDAWGIRQRKEAKR